MDTSAYTFVALGRAVYGMLSCGVNIDLNWEGFSFLIFYVLIRYLIYENIYIDEHTCLWTVSYLYLLT